MARDHRFDVFVGSGGELRHEREALVSRLSESDLVRVWEFEQHAGAQHSDAISAYLEALGDDAVFVGLYWRRLEERQLDEYEIAKQTGVPCLLYVKQVDEEVRTKRLQRFLEAETGPGGLTPFYFKKTKQLVKQVPMDIARVVARRLNAPRVQHDIGGLRLVDPAPEITIRPERSPPGLRRPAWPFVDYDGALEMVVESIEDGVPGIAVIGGPGMGKTDLLKAIVHEEWEGLQDGFPDGLVYLDGRLTGEHGSPLQIIWSEFYETDSGFTPDWEQYRSGLGDKRALILLDGLGLAAEELEMLQEALVDSVVVVADLPDSGAARMDEVVELTAPETPEDIVELFMRSYSPRREVPAEVRQDVHADIVRLCKADPRPGAIASLARWARRKASRPDELAGWVLTGPASG